MWWGKVVRRPTFLTEILFPITSPHKETALYSTNKFHHNIWVCKQNRESSFLATDSAVTGCIPCACSVTVVHLATVTPLKAWTAIPWSTWTKDRQLLWWCETTATKVEIFVLLLKRRRNYVQNYTQDNFIDGIGRFSYWNNLMLEVSRFIHHFWTCK